MPYREQPEPTELSEMERKSRRSEWANKLCDLVRKEGENYYNYMKGLDDIEVWLFREENIDNNPYGVAISLAGLDSVSAWNMRDRLLAIDDKRVKSGVIRSLSGLDSERARNMRGEFLDSSPRYNYDIVISLEGIDSEKAWEMRKMIYNEANNINLKFEVVKSTRGIDSPEAWELREQYIEDKTVGKSGNYNFALMHSLVGIDNEKAWAMRDKFRGGDSEVCPYLGGIDSKRAWKIRNRVLKSDEEGAQAMVVYGLSMINSKRANKIRRQFLDDYPTIVARSLEGLEETPEVVDLKNDLFQNNSDNIVALASLLK